MLDRVSDKIKPEQQVSQDPQNSVTLPARFYYEEDVYKRELNQIFFKTWMYACHDSQLPEPGNYVTTDIADQKLFLIRGRDNVIRAFYNACSHRGHILLEGPSGKKPLISCPYHAWAFTPEGDLKVAPGTDTVPSFDPTQYGLTEVRTEEIAGFRFINLDENAETLREFLPGFEEEIRADVAQLDDLVFREDSEGLALPGDVQCNWKLLVENFQECYHCAPAHKSLCTLFDVREYKTDMKKNYTSAHAVTHKFEEMLENNAFTIYEDDPQKVGRFWFIWPNLSFTSIPGTPNVSIYRIDPLAPEVAANWTQAFRLADDNSEQNEARSDWGCNDAGPEDKALCEAVQKGMHQRGFTQGRIVYSEDGGDEQAGGENAVHWHSRKVVEAIGY